MCTDFEMLKVKVPVIFLGTVGFSLRRDGRKHRYVYRVSIALRSKYPSFLSAPWVSHNSWRDVRMSPT